MYSLIPYIIVGATSVALYQFSKTRKLANGCGIEQFPPKGELKNRDNLLLKYEKIGNDYEFYVCGNKDCSSKMSYKQFINYLYTETYLDNRTL